MDELTAALATSFQVTKEENSTAAPHPRFSQYKAKRRPQEQEERRKRMLESQKQRRYDFMNLARRLAEDKWDDMEAEDGEEDDEESMECSGYVRKPGRYYSNQLMLSEWMVEVPSDFATHWFMMPCPVGRRNLIVASRGKTCAYSKSGYKVRTFHSLLPGGSRKQSSDYTVLDCIFSEIKRVYFILDVMCWKGHPVYDCETEFRFYWRQQKLDEIPDLSVQSKSNPFPFLSLPHVSCSEENIKSLLKSYADVELDGLLYYHKQTHYTFGTTPLVTWLKPYMIPEILGVPIPEHYMSNKPTSYTDFATHVEKVIKDREETKKQKESGNMIHGARRTSYDGQHLGETSENQNEAMEVSKGQGHRRRNRERRSKDDQKMDILIQEDTENHSIE